MGSSRSKEVSVFWLAGGGMGVPLGDGSVTAAWVVGGCCHVGWEVLFDDVVCLFECVGEGGVGSGCAVF